MRRLRGECHIRLTERNKAERARVYDSTECIVFLTSGTSWTVPNDWNSSNNTIGVIGGGGSGAGTNGGTNGGGGGGG
jgi:hypothetical protein